MTRSERPEYSAAELYDVLCDKFREVTTLAVIPDSALNVLSALCEDKDTVHLTLADFCATWAMVLSATASAIQES